MILTLLFVVDSVRLDSAVLSKEIFKVSLCLPISILAISVGGGG
ncbi:hypothetical protein [Helicobacter bilis]|nr:hypothetical protein [Helicobacter bilis]